LLRTLPRRGMDEAEGAAAKAGFVPPAAAVCLASGAVIGAGVAGAVILAAWCARRNQRQGASWRRSWRPQARQWKQGWGSALLSQANTSKSNAHVSPCMSHSNPLRRPLCAGHRRRLRERTWSNHVRRKSSAARCTVGDWGAVCGCTAVCVAPLVIRICCLPPCVCVCRSPPLIFCFRRGGPCERRGFSASGNRLSCPVCAPQPRSFAHPPAAPRVCNGADTERELCCPHHRSLRARCLQTPWCRLPVCCWCAIAA